MIFLLIVKVFGMTLQMSQMESRQKELVQRIALDPVSYTHLDVYKRQDVRRRVKAGFERRSSA